MNSIGAGVSYLQSGSPLEATTGFRVRYAHLYELGHPPSGSPDAAAVSKPIQQALLLVTGVGAMRMDREAAGSALEGQLSFTQLSAALLWSPSSKRRKWGWGVGAGADYFIADAKGTFEVPAPLGISNRYDVDSGPGFHAEVDWMYAVGNRVQFYASLGYLEAILKGEHRFVVSGVAGAPEAADFDLSGAVVEGGVSCRF